MFSAKKLELKPLKPFVLRIREGYLVGLAMDPGEGSPCVNCVTLWLETRKVWVEPAKLSDLKVRRDVLADLIEANDGHVFYEITQDGMANRLETVVFPHPDCVCEKTNYVGPKKISENSNFAFSPLVQIKCARFATPSGNLWLTSASGQTPLKQKLVTVYAVQSEKQASRLLAVERWMKRAANDEISHRLETGDAVPVEALQTGDVEVRNAREGREKRTAYETLGAGATREEAILHGLFELAKQRTLKQYSSSVKNPMLIVGANNWLRMKVPFFLLQQFDLHLLFYPNSSQAWVVGLAAFSRMSVEEKPVFVFEAHAEVGKAVEGAIYRLLETVRSQDFDGESWNEKQSKQTSARASKLNMWWTHWIYRCPKISLKDVLHLEAYPKTVETWRDYYRDGQDKVSILAINHSLLPSTIRHLVRLEMASNEKASNVRNINGIATWSDFRDGLQ